MDNFNVFVEGDNDGFNSQNAKYKFKQFVKQQFVNNNVNNNANNNVNNLESLCLKYIKSDYELKFISYKDNNVTVRLSKKVTQPEQKKFSKRDMLKAKIKMMSDKRTNVNYYRAKNSDNVSNDLLTAYNNACKHSSLPIPEPSEIMKNPDQYKLIVKTLLSSPEFKNKNPYTTYFKLLGQYLNVDSLDNNDLLKANDLLVQANNYLDNNNNNNNTINAMQEKELLNSLMASNINNDVKGNVVDTNADTDSESNN